MPFKSAAEKNICEAWNSWKFFGFQHKLKGMIFTFSAWFIFLKFADSFARIFLFPPIWNINSQSFSLRLQILSRSPYTRKQVLFYSCNNGNKNSKSNFNNNSFDNDTGNSTECSTSFNKSCWGKCERNSF